MLFQEMSAITLLSKILCHLNCMCIEKTYEKTYDKKSVRFHSHDDQSDNLNNLYKYPRCGIQFIFLCFLNYLLSYDVV